MYISDLWSGFPNLGHATLTIYLPFHLSLLIPPTRPLNCAGPNGAIWHMVALIESTKMVGRLDINQSRIGRAQPTILKGGGIEI